MFGNEFLRQRYLSLSIIGILMAQIAAIALIFKAIFQKNEFTVNSFVLFICLGIILMSKSMVALEFHESCLLANDLKDRFYIASINMAIKRNPRIKIIELSGFPEVERFLYRLRLLPSLRNIDFIEKNGGNRKVPDLTILYKERYLK